MRRTLLALAFLATSLSAPAMPADPAWRWDNVPRVVVFGDVHGAYHELVPLLQQTGVIDASLHWSGGTTHLVSLGDLLDRGPDSRAVMDLLMRLEAEALRAGGRVHVILGNHEVMNLRGDLRYVSAAEYAAFAEPSVAASVDPSVSPALPPGYAEHRQAFAATGRYGAWLLDKPLLIVINDTAYVHGGVPASIAALGLIDGNTRFKAELLEALASQPATPGEPPAQPTSQPVTPGDLLSDAGPLWYRGTARCHVLIEGDRLQRSLDRLAVRRVVIGHTPTPILRAQSRFAGDVVMLDTGMLAQVYHGRASALVIEGGGDRVVVAGDTSVNSILPETGAYAGEWATSDRIATLLENAPVSRSSKTVGGAKGELEVTLTTTDGPLAARFVPLSKQQLQHEVAAYRLDRLLRLGIVSPAVAREIDGKRGLLRAADSGWTSERARRDSGKPRVNECESGNDYLLMQAFDALIGNDARTTDNLGYERGTGELRLRGFTDAFRRGGLRGDAAVEWPRLPQGLRDRLVALDERTLVDAFGDQLEARDIEAVLERRNAIVNPWPILE